jgi:hypothetical protein
LLFDGCVFIHKKSIILRFIKNKIVPINRIVTRFISYSYNVM